MRRLRDENIRRLKNAAWRSLKLGKKLRRAAFKHLPVALRRGETLYRRMATTLGASKPTIAKDVVVTLTSFPLRIGKLHHVISSLLDQSVQPRKVVLYLALDEFPGRSIPKSLARLQGDRFEVRFVSENLRPHNKLQYALTDFPETWIATSETMMVSSSRKSRPWGSLNWLEKISTTPGRFICAPSGDASILTSNTAISFFLYAAMARRLLLGENLTSSVRPKPAMVSSTC